ncbi:MAG: hypothetical protein JNN11_02325 [Candidatus Doudnabacteria bacterium]|nr:hypothetical protein [Candidatus Doudnabacteria bacterium]
MGELSKNTWEGQEKKVTMTGSELVTAEYKFVVSRNLIKGLYYLNNLLEILLPHHIPHIRQAGANKYIADFVPHDERHEKLQSNLDTEIGLSVEEDVEKDVRIKELNAELLELGIYGDNKSGRNYIIDPSGKAEYVDAILPWQIIKVFNKSSSNQTSYGLDLNVDFNKLSEKVSGLPDPSLKQKAASFLSRLNQLWEEESQKQDLSEYLHKIN